MQSTFYTYRQQRDTPKTKTTHAAMICVLKTNVDAKQTLSLKQRDMFDN